MAVVSAAAAQTPPAANQTADQIDKDRSPAASASTVDQIGRTAASAFVVQLDPKLKERASQTAAEGLPLRRPAQDPVTFEMAPVRRDPGSVDADEIARLLAAGEAASIDAAAAIADADARERAAALEDSPETRKRDPRAP